MQSQRSTQQAVPAPSVSAAGPPKDAAVYGAMLASLSPPPGDPSWYRWQARTQTWHCTLCWKTADDNHVASARHKRRVQWMENEALMGALPVPVAGPPQSDAVENATLVYPSRPPGDPTWYTWKVWTQTWYCELCWRTADEHHIGSERHKGNVYWKQKQALTGQPPLAANAWGQQLSPPQVQPLQSAQPLPPQEQPPPPPPRRQAITVSPEHQPPPPPPQRQQPLVWECIHLNDGSDAHFFLNRSTGEQRFELPKGVMSFYEWF